MGAHKRHVSLPIRFLTPSEAGFGEPTEPRESKSFFIHSQNNLYGGVTRSTQKTNHSSGLAVSNPLIYL